MRYTQLVLVIAVVGYFFLGAMSSSCEKVAGPDQPPRTFFQTDGAPPETLSVDHFTFRWFGTDLDSDVAQYYYKLLVGASCGTTVPTTLDNTWKRTRDQQASYSFADVHTYPDGHYVFAVMTEDEQGARNVTPRLACFYLQPQQAPVATITNYPRSRGLPAADFAWTAVKRNRQGDSLNVSMKYSFQFVETGPNNQVLNLWTRYGTVTTTTFTVSKGISYKFQVKAAAFPYDGTVPGYPLIESDVAEFAWDN